MTTGPPEPAPQGSPANGTHAAVARLSVVVHDPQGLHLRPAGRFAKVARQYHSSVTVLRDGKSVNGKSQIDLLLLAAEPGAELTIEACGADARDALAALGGIFEIVNWDEDEAAAAPPQG
jgi:phosphotransferase system HPr (HPr) family protein